MNKNAPEVINITSADPVIRGSVDDNGNDVLIVTGPGGTYTIEAGDVSALGDALDAVAL